MIILGIETSCDETAAAIVNDQRQILSNIVRAQLNNHEQFGGVVPEIAARLHLDILDKLIIQAMKKANVNWSDLDAIAATGGPGLIGGVIVGTMMAKAIATVHDLPYIAVNHLAGHALTARLTDNVEFPYLLLLVSGGHCQLLVAYSPTRFELLGQTIDDAIGEAFDKTGRLVGFAYPAGPKIEQSALQGDPKRFDFPRPLVITKGQQKYSPYDFSLSGLKTAVRRTVESNTPLSKQDINDLCASFQAAVGDIVVDRSRNALAYARKHKIPLKHFVIAGGVAANQYLRQRLLKVSEEYNVPFVAPPVSLCTDNAAMIAWAGIELLRLGHCDALGFAPRPRWPLTEEKRQ